MNNTYYPTIACALVSLRPGADFSVVGNTYSGIYWLSEDQSIPTEDEVNAEILVLAQQWENKQYQRDRKPAYPSIEDQLDLLYHQGYDGWKAKILEIKNQYPKPTVGVSTT